jgi:hypothetical protein
VGFKLDATALYTFYVDSTILSKQFAISNEKPDKKALTIYENIILILSLPKLVYVIILKCLSSLLVMGLLPPPGGPIAQMNMISSILINGFSFSFLLYHP